MHHSNLIFPSLEGFSFHSGFSNFPAGGMFLIGCFEGGRTYDPSEKTNPGGSRKLSELQPTVGRESVDLNKKGKNNTNNNLKIFLSKNVRFSQ